MASQQDIRRRIRSVRNTRKITKAMELVAGAKLRRAQERIEALRPYADRCRSCVEAAAAPRAAGQPLLRGARRRVAVLGSRATAAWPARSTRSVLRRSLRSGARAAGEGQEVVWYAVGKRGAGSLRFRGLEIGQAWTGFTDSPVYADAERSPSGVEEYVEDRVDRVLLVYNHFDSPLAQKLVVDQLLPVPERPADRRASPRRSRAPPVRARGEDMLADLLPTSVEIAVFRALLESTASEHGARMTAMRNASENASDLIDAYTLPMNRARQAEITQEILEVVAGADALE